MSTNDWAPGADDTTAVRQPLPRTDEQAVAPVPLPRATDVDPHTGAPVEPVPSPSFQAPGDALGATAVRPTVPGSSEVTWGSAPKIPAPPAPPPPPQPAWTDPSATALRPSAVQHSAPVPPAPLPPRKDDTRAAALGVMIAAIVLVAGGGGFYLNWSRSSGVPSSSISSPTTDFSGSLPAGGSDPSSGTNSSDGGSVSGATPDTNSAPTSEPAPVDPEVAAQQQLEAMRSDSMARLPLDGRWVAQVASKSVGITDPLQTAGNGSHTFYATDILAESLRARSTVSNPDSNVYVVWGTDFGKRSQAPDGSPYWITLVDAGFGSSNAVKGWCQSTYSYLTPAQLADTCAARQLTPPHS